MRRTIHIERKLGAPPDAIFAILADHARYDRFDGIRHSELVKDGNPAPNGVGAIRKIAIGPLVFEEEITEYEQPSRLGYLIKRINLIPFRHAGGSIRLTGDGSGTHAEWTSSFEIPIPLIGGILDQLFKLRLERGFAQVLDRSAQLATNASA